LIQQTIDSTMGNTTSIPDDAIPPTDVPAATIETTVSAPAIGVGVEKEEKEKEEHVEGIEKLIRDLSSSDNATVDAALDTLSQDLEDDVKRDTITAWGGCAALVHLLKDRLKKEVEKIPPCDQVTELNELPELKTIQNTLHVLVLFTYYSEMGRVGISTVGGVAAVIETMESFTKCQPLQDRACHVLGNLACCSIGKANIIESGGIEVLLAAIDNHLGSAYLCTRACAALSNIVCGSKERTETLIDMGGGAAVAKVRKEWPDNNDVQIQVRKVAYSFAAEWKAWAEKGVSKRPKDAASPTLFQTPVKGRLVSNKKVGTGSVAPVCAALAVMVAAMWCQEEF
jgi:hypothetical protein